MGQEEEKKLKEKISELEALLLKSEDKFRSVADSAPVGLFLDDAQGNAIYINKKCAELVGVKAEDALKMDWIPYLHPDDRDLMVSEWKKAFKNGTKFNLEYRWVHSDGKIVWTLGEVNPIKDENGEVVLFIGSLTDITSRKKAEEEKEKLQEQLQQAQKMQAIGRLAGGVAHDYNNMLYAIMGFTELAMNEIGSESKAYKMLQQVSKAAKRSVDTTQQLLKFSRKQSTSPKVFDINSSIDSMYDILCRLIGAEIKIIWEASEESLKMEMDPSQFDQMVVNLCINARDAIGGVGEIKIQTSYASFDKVYCQNNSAYQEGNFVQLSITDNGCGMDQLTQESIFEPFFTTKEENKGTGLGLAGVYGTVKQSNGFIVVDSKEGEGSTFKIYVPLIEDSKNEESKVVEKEISEGHGEIILAVEDEASILEIVNYVLSRSKYQVLTAKDPNEAITIAKKHPKIDMILTDVIMPEMNGRDLAEKISKIHPDIKFLYMSGYTADVLNNESSKKNFNFIQKPFKAENLVLKVQEVLSK